MNTVIDPDKEVKLNNGVAAKVTHKTHNGYGGKIAAGLNDWWHAQVWDEDGHNIGNQSKDYDLVEPS